MQRYENGWLNDLKKPCRQKGLLIKNKMHEYLTVIVIKIRLKALLLLTILWIFEALHRVLFCKVITFLGFVTKMKPVPLFPELYLKL
jgi:hypothetical protein